MTKSRIPQAKILKILRENELGTPIPELLERYNISLATFYNWKKKYKEHDIAESTRLADLEEENDRLKRMYADLSLENMFLKHEWEKMMAQMKDKENTKRK